MFFIPWVDSLRGITGIKVLIELQTTGPFQNRDTFILCNTWVYRRFIYHYISFFQYLAHSLTGLIQWNQNRSVRTVDWGGDGDDIKIAVSNVLQFICAVQTGFHFRSVAQDSL